MMDRYVCVHGHFYQPPRENPWLEAVEIQDSAHPYHDWNERITAECYAPNSASRILGGDGRIMDIVSNYSKISFNFGPTLLSWMEKYSPETYRAVIDSDRESSKKYSGHGNAMAQVYNHIIMPLANSRDKRTQIIWGLKDFEHRFKRSPEGIWLSEAAVDMETLHLLAEFGIKYTVLAPHQAARIRKTGVGKWREISGGNIDPTRPYLCRLPSGLSIALFFYDGPISQGVAFEKILNRGEDFANRLLSGFSSNRDWPQLLHIATDGETYGHHHRFGDMALAYALDYIEANNLARLTNYGEYLEKYPPTYEVQINDSSSWSCAHGIERWRSDCGCNSGGRPGWNQGWRGPLRDSLDWLRDLLEFRFDLKARQYLKEPWTARDEYIDIVLDRSEENVGRFIERHAARELDREDISTVMKLLEVQRQAMLMYASCGWFFDELSGIETVQILQYAGRAIQLSEELFSDSIENNFLLRLSRAKSNLKEHENGAAIYNKFVKPARLDMKKVAAHYAVSSLFEDYADETDIYSYSVKREDFRKVESERIKLATGKIAVSSIVTRESEIVTFCTLYAGDYSLKGGVRTFLGDDAYLSMKEEISAAFENGAVEDIANMMDAHFGMHNYSIANLFRDEQRKILNILIGDIVEGFARTYHDIYENNRLLMAFIHETGMPVPKAFFAAAEFTLNAELERSLKEGIDVDRLQDFVNDIKKWEVPLDSLNIEYIARHKFENMAKAFYTDPADLMRLLEVQKVLEALRMLPVEINYWHIQNIYCEMAKSVYKRFLNEANAGNESAGKWIDSFRYLGELLFFNIFSILPEAGISSQENKDERKDYVTS